MTPETFFQGRLTGWGAVRDLFGRVLRRYTVELEGSWSEEHRALHLDETYTYVTGDTHQRRWAIHTDEEGYIIGHDALEVARMRGRQTGADFQIVFDRLRQAGSSPFQPIQVIRFVEVSPEQSLMIGEIKQFGFTVGAIMTALTRIS